MDLISTATIEFGTLGLNGLSARHKAIASNIANADTPGYKRMDVTFEDQLGKIINTENMKENQRVLNSMDNGVLAAMGGNTNSAAMKGPLAVNYDQASMRMEDFQPQTIESDLNSPNTNGNSVDIEQEMSELTKTGMSYNAVASLQSKEFKGLAEIIRGS